MPWYTYTCRAFLEPRLSRSMRAFEYGAGNSTLWYAARIVEVVAVEHDAGWAEKVRGRAPANCHVVLADDDAYVNAVKSFHPFDIVVVDGLRRAETAIAALDNLKHDGVFVWDNSDLPEFGDAFPTLEGHGFRKLSFKGIGLASRQGWETSTGTGRAIVGIDRSPGPGPLLMWGAGPHRRRGGCDDDEQLVGAPAGGPSSPVVVPNSTCNDAQKILATRRGRAASGSGRPGSWTTPTALST